MSSTPDLWHLYRQMLKSRLFEEAVTKLWEEGLISGEMHLGTGEEAIVAGILDHLVPGDALALDHRGTPPMIMRGIDPSLLLNEFLGRPSGLCSGMGGHMHLFSREHLIASSGIVGASAPTATGFALAAKALRPGTVSVAFFGDAAINQGMLMEAVNLAVVWQLPVVFVCKDDNWGITTRSDEMTGGSIQSRAVGLGVKYVELNGHDVESTWKTANKSISEVRSSGNPVFLHASCVHLEGHFLGYQLLRAARKPWTEMPGLTKPLMRSFSRRGGAPVKKRIEALKSVTDAIRITAKDPRECEDRDPVLQARNILKSDAARLAELELEIEQELGRCLAGVIREESE